MEPINWKNAVDIDDYEDIELAEITSSPFIYLIESEAEYEDEINNLELNTIF